MTTLHVTRHDDGTMAIEMSPPVPVKGGEVALLALKEPTARQVREAERDYNPDAPYAGAVAYELKLVGLVAGLDATTMDKLPVGAVNVAATFLQEFIEAGAADPGADDADEPAPEATMLSIVPPITFAGISYGDLEVREPLASEIRNARQLMRSAGSLFESRRAQMSLVTAVSGLPAPVIDALPISQLNAASRLLGRFTVAGRRTGKR